MLAVLPAFSSDIAAQPEQTACSGHCCCCVQPSSHSPRPQSNASTVVTRSISVQRVAREMDRPVFIPPPLPFQSLPARADSSLPAAFHLPVLERVCVLLI